jgi:GNAT superfamily N-acetyltransferase
VCEIDGDPVAFYALDVPGDGCGELDALFVKPGYIGQGIGKLLVQHMSGEAAARGVRSVTIQGDPNAEEFYLSIGATPAGYRESASIRGRYLPVFVLTIAEGRL